MLVRLMKQEDLQAVAELSAQLGYPSPAAEVERRFMALDEDPAHGLFVAEGPGSGVVGWVHVHGRLLLECDSFAEIGGLVVDEGCRGQGIGQALLEEAERWAAGRGYAEVRVRSNTVRTEAHHFYRRMGYRLVKSQHVFCKPGPQDIVDQT